MIKDFCQQDQIWRWKLPTKSK